MQLSAPAKVHRTIKAMQASVIASTTPTLSVVIPVYGSWQAARVLDAVLPLGAMEILVCDSSPVPTALPSHPSVRLIHLQQRAFPGAARNAGWQQAQGDFVLFVDADVVLTSEAHQFVQRHIASDPHDMAFGLYTSDCPDYNSISRFLVNIQRHRFEQEFARNHFRYGQSSHVLIRRDLFKKTGYFNPHLRMHEDKEICIRAINAGVDINVYPEFLSDHIKIFSFMDLMKDHGYKAYLAREVQFNNPDIFNRVENQLSTRFKSSLILSFLAPLLLLLLGILHVLSPGTILLLLAIFLLSPLVAAHEVFMPSAWREKITGMLLWPFMGATICSGVMLANIRVYWQAFSRKIRYVPVLAEFTKRVFIRRGLPVSIIHFVTSRCNLRCEHCFYKETLDLKDPGEQSLQQFDKTTREIGPVLWYALGGGEPFLRSDLHDIHRLIMKNCQPMMISIPTNGWYTDKTYLKTLQMLQQMQRGALTVQISVDGPESIHDDIRGKDSWRHLVKTWHKLKELQRLYPQLSLGIITVVNNSNYHTYPGFIDELVDTFQPNQISVNLIRDMENLQATVDIPVLDAYKHAIERYEWHIQHKALTAFGYLGGAIVRAKESIQKEMIYRVMRFNEFVTPCTAGALTYVIWEDGRVNACEMLPDSVGNILGDKDDNNFRNIVKSNTAKQLRQKIVAEQCKCSYECAMTINTLFSWPFAKKLWYRVISGAVGHYSN
jgi:MoaA/NifB/PqqE/SkfB family radical SAM enzyme/glycosyltransferase involved in cell wall biosynthesis